MNATTKLLIDGDKKTSITLNFFRIQLDGKSQDCISLKDLTESFGFNNREKYNSALRVRDASGTSIVAIDMVNRSQCLMFQDEFKSKLEKLAVDRRSRANQLLNSFETLCIAVKKEFAKAEVIYWKLKTHI